jgi:hypothetical protein
MNLNEDVENLILEYLGLKCHQCNLKLNSVKLISNSKKYGCFYFCSNDCLNFI